MIILGTKNPLLQFLIHISKIEQKMKKIKWQICRKFIWSPYEPLLTIIKTNSSKNWERYNAEIVKPFCIPLWIINNNFTQANQIQTRYEKDKMTKVFHLVPLWAINNNYGSNSSKNIKYTMMILQKIHFASPCELLTTIYMSKFKQEMKNT